MPISIDPDGNSLTPDYAQTDTVTLNGPSAVRFAYDPTTRQAA